MIHRELPVTVLASVLGARRGQSLPAHFAVHPRPEPRLHVTAARCTVFTTATGTLLLAPAVDEAAQRRGERRLHPATSNTQAREETVEKGDERGESTIPPRERGRGERERKRYRVSALAATTCLEAKRLYSRARAKGRQTTGEGGIRLLSICEAKQRKRRGETLEATSVGKLASFLSTRSDATLERCLLPINLLPRFRLTKFAKLEKTLEYRLSFSSSPIGNEANGSKRRDCTEI